MESIAIIGSGEMAVIIARNAKKMGVITHSFSNNNNDRVVGISDYHHNIDIFAVDEIVQICREIGIKGVLPTTELTVDIAARVAEVLGLPGMPTSISSNVTDKGFVRNKARNVDGLMQPHYLIWTIGDPIPTGLNFPVVVKPTSMGGKRGVMVVPSAQELENALQYAKDNMPASKRQIIIEEYIGDGMECSVESLSYHGSHYVIQVTEKISSGPPHCVELGHIQPARLKDNIRSKIEKVIPMLLEAVGVDNSTSHTEIKVCGDQIYLIELNARSGGDHIAYPLTELSTGYPYIQGAISVAMDCFQAPEKKEMKNGCSGVVFVAQQTKELKSLFDTCDEKAWLYKKNKTTDDLVTIINNQAFDTNYMIFHTNNDIPKEILDALTEMEKRKDCSCYDHNNND